MVERTRFSKDYSSQNCEVLNLVEPQPLPKLVEIKRAKSLTVSLVLPTLNEERTVGRLIDCWSKLGQKGLVDELIVVDSGSSDATEVEVRNRQVPFFRACNKLSEMGFSPVYGKGANIWFSQFLTKGDILVFADADMENPKQETLVNLVSPLICHDDKMLVKSIFSRQTRDENGKLAAGGRITELVAKPAIKLLFPELTGVIQPLNGNIAIRRSALEKLPLGSQYQVDLQILLGVFLCFGSEAIAQADCGTFRQNGNDLEKLRLMSFQVLKVILEAAADCGRLKLIHPLPFDASLIEQQESYLPPAATLKMKKVS